MDWSRVKVTPLNLVVALCFAYAFYCLLGFEKTQSGFADTPKVIYTLLLALILSFTDIIFRRFINNTKWIWLIQGSFIFLITMMIIIFQKI
jgi:putative effector of murein hydrolase